MKLCNLPSLRSDERGMGLLFGLLCAAIVAVITWTMMTNGLVDMAIADNYRSKSTAFYAADAGVEQTLIDLKVDDAWINTFVDLDAWQVKSGLPGTIDINGNTVTLAFDGSGNVIPQYYQVGSPTTLGDGTYVRELYLPPIVAPGDCAAVQDPGDPGTGSSDGSSTSGSSSSGSSSSGSSSSGSSSSGSSSSGSSSSGSSSSGSSSGFLSAATDTLSDLVAQAGFLLAPAGLLTPEKITICHVPPGNPDNAHSISITTSSWPAHEAHGDSQGACADSSGSSSSGSSSSGSSSSGSGGAAPSADVSPYDPCDLLANIDGSGGGSSSSTSGSSSSGSSTSGSSTSGSSSSGSSSSGSSSGSDSLASMVNTQRGNVDRALLLVASASMVGNGPKVTICHVPPGNPSNAQTLTVGASAVGAHLSNHSGDSIGACDSASGSSSSGSSSSGSSGSSSSDCDDSGSGGSSSSSSSSGSSSSGSSSSGSSSSGSSSSGSSSSGSSSSGSSSSGSSSSGSSSSGSGSCAGADGGSSGGGSNPNAPVSSYIIFAVRSTGNGGLTEQSNQVIVAELSFLVGSDENVYDIAVQNWRREH